MRQSLCFYCNKKTILCSVLLALCAVGAVASAAYTVSAKAWSVFGICTSFLCLCVMLLLYFVNRSADIMLELDNQTLTSRIGFRSDGEWTLSLGEIRRFVLLSKDALKEIYGTSHLPNRAIVAVLDEQRGIRKVIPCTWITQKQSIRILSVLNACREEAIQ